MKSKVLCVILMLILISIFSYKVYEFKNTILNSRANNNEEIDIYKEDYKNTINLKKDKKEIFNILLLGIDREENASDSIMILSINKETNTIKLVSVMRDTFVYQGEGMANKMNYAYHYGGTEGSINTINRVFNLDIKKYVKTDFDSLIKIIDYLGGINISINEEEREYINSSCKRFYLNSAGDVGLNGEQTLAYARTRKIDSDFERTGRQRKVMKALLIKFKNLEVYKYPEVLYELKKISQTNLSVLEVLKYGDIVFSCDENNLSEFRIPIDGTWSDNTKSVYHLDWEEEINKEALHNFIYN